MKVTIHEPLQNQRRTWQASGRPLNELAFDSEGNVLATLGNGDNRAKLWDARNGALLAEFPVSPNSICLGLSRNARWLALGDPNGEVRLWDLHEARRRLGLAGLDWCDEALPTTNLPASSMVAKAWHSYHLGQYDEAERLYTQILSVNQQQPLILLARGESYFALGKYREALADFVRAKSMMPGSIEPYLADRARFFVEKDNQLLHTAEDHAKNGRFKEALVSYEKLIGDPLSAARTWYHAADVYLALEDEASYRRLCRDLLLRYHSTEDGEAANLTAWTCALRPDSVTDLSSALRLSEMAVAKDPQSDAKLFTLATVLYRTGRYSDALQRLKDSAKARQSPDDAWDFILGALIQDRLGRKEEAKALYGQGQRWLEENKDKKLKTWLWTERVEIQQFANEARTLIEGKPLGP
jgi:tetratricopeptide (TPR) repeat protein